MILRVMSLQILIFSFLLTGCNISSDSELSDRVELQPKINITRTEGQLPFHVYVSASDTQFDGVDYPYDEINYEWDFGDGDGSEYFTNPVTHEKVNSNSDQFGPEAAYVYQDAGDYQITLTASYVLNDETVTETTTLTIKADEWSGDTRYIDPELGDDNNNGLSEESPWKTWTATAQWLSGDDYRQALIKRGRVMSVVHNMNSSRSHIRIGAYGEGENPILRADDDIDNFIRLYPNGDQSDHIYSDLTLDGNNGNAGSLIYSALIDDSGISTLKHMAFIHLTLINNDPHTLQNGEEVIQATNFISLQNRYDNEIDDVLVWGTTFARNRSFKNGIYAEMKKHFAVVGATFSGGEGSSLKDHPIYPAGVSHALYRWIDFQETISNNYSINSAAKEGKILRYTLVDSCSITGGSNGLDFTKHNEDAKGWFGDLIIQNNAIFNLGNPSQGIGVYGGSLERAVIRNNVFYGNPQSDIFVKKDSSDPEEDIDLVIKDNIFWKSGERTDTLAMLDLQDVQTLRMNGNILVNDGVKGGSTLLGQFRIPEHSQWIVDGNQYWAPEISTPFKVLADINEYFSFEQWQEKELDVNSLHEDPLFSDPAQGQF